MEPEGFIENYFPKIKSNLLPLGLGLLGLILLSIGLISSLNSNSKEDVTFQPAETINPSISQGKITVDVSGAVIKPGVYDLKVGDRVKDALIAAAGLSQNADKDWVSKNLNLAQKLSDGAKIFIPRIGENPSAGSGQASLGVVSVSGLININSATSSELDTLPGVGPVTAQKIIGNRPYQTIEDLLTKKSVNQSVFDKIKDKITY